MGQFKLAIVIFLSLLTLITLVIGVNKPDLHKQTIFTDEYHSFVEEEIPTSDISISNIQTPTAQTNFEPIKPVQKTPLKQVYTNQPKTSAPTKSKQNTPIKKDTPTTLQTTNTTPKVEIKSQEQTQSKPHQLTEQEEIIAWNAWRSNLQNQVMKDAPTYAPIGTVFKFSFTVDKFGNMSNIKVWSTNPNYTNKAVQVIKPVLMSYSHKPILNFPTGTKRVITNVTGGYVISTQTKYSSPSDYSDYEKVKRYY